MVETDRQHDYSDFEDGKMELGKNAIARLQSLAQNQVDAEARVASLEEQLSEAQGVVNDIRLYKLPDLMDELELAEFTTKAGVKLTMSEEIRVGIKKDNQPEAYKWLEDNDEGGMIKRQMVIEFGRDDNKWADKFERDCARRRKPLNLKRKLSVHNQTLLKFVKDQLAEGVDFPMALFGVFRQRFVKVKLPKE